MFNLHATHKSWHPILKECLREMDPAYLQKLENTSDWLPGKDKIFNAFSLPLPNIQRILFGESPYPRPQSANGYAFWDNAVGTIWSEAGLSKAVNKATSLRNFIKMLLIINKPPYVETLSELFQNFLSHGFLLLNATPVLHLHQNKVKEDAKYWQPLMAKLLDKLYLINPDVELIFFGKIALQIDPLLKHPYKKIYAEHPYNLSFINNPVVINYFKPLHLLSVGAIGDRPFDTRDDLN